MWKEAVGAYFEVLSRNLHGLFEENNEKLLLNNLCSARDSNQAPSECKLENLPLQPTFSVLGTKKQVKFREGFFLQYLETVIFGCSLEKNYMLFYKFSTRFPRTKIANMYLKYIGTFLKSRLTDFQISDCAVMERPS
jgi:hypothetical protein